MVSRSPAGVNQWDAGSFNARNQIADPNWSYDSNGNITKSPIPETLGYDAENRQVAHCTNMSADGTSCPNQYLAGSGQTVYVYDGLGNRVQQIDIYGAVTTFVYDAFGNLVAEYGAIAPPMGGTEYATADALGSTRLVMSGTQAAERHDFQPYADEITADTGTWRTGVPGYLNSLNLYGTGTMRQRFTGQERDAETGLDYFQARYFSGIQGRFTSPDPGNAGADPFDPQSWNGYAYVSNNPLTFTDPSGLIAEAGGGDSDRGGDWGGVIVGGFELLGEGIADLVGLLGGGHHTDLSKVAWTPPSGPFSLPGPFGSPGGGACAGFAQACQPQPSGPNLPISGINIAALVRYLQCSALPQFGQHQCSKHVYDAFQAAGANFHGMIYHNGSTWGPLLKAMGCNALPQQPDIDYGPAAGDIMVFQPVPGQDGGHVRVWDGKEWVSDWIQNNNGSRPYPGPTYRKAKADYVVYRCH